MTEEGQIDDPALLLEFIADARELLEKMDPILLDLEKDPENQQSLNELLRSLHTIKGTSGFLNLGEISLLSHKIEDVLKAVQEKEVTPDNRTINIVFEGVDTLNRLVKRITQSEDEKIGEILGEKIESEKIAEINVNSIIEDIDSLLKGGAQPPKLPPNVVEQFIVETNEHFEVIEPLLIKLENDPQDFEAIDDIFRSMHTIKGNSDYVGLSEIKKVSHKIEGLLDRLRKKEMTLTPEIIEIMFEGIDILKILTENITQKHPEPISTDKLFKRLEKILTKTDGIEVSAEEKESSHDDGLNIFFNSADQHIEAICTAIKEIIAEKERDAALDILLRSLSSLKTSAEYMGQEEIVKTAKALLDTAEAIGTIGFDNILLQGLSPDTEKLKETINSSRDKISTTTPQTEKTESPTETYLTKHKDSQKREKSKIKEIKTVRVEQEKLDIFMNLVGELVVTRNAFNHLTQKLELEHDLRDLRQQMKNLSSQVNRISEGLQNKVMEIRMVPVKNVFQRFPRMVRDLAVKMGKKVELVIQGEDTEIDKTVAEAVGDPLVHLIRNAVDHGIEAPEERKKTGKRETGTIILKASHDGNSVTIEITDDGHGIDEKKILSKAIEKGLVTKEAAERLSHNNIINFVFSPGFSTATSVTDVSGRGVGMDVVKSNIHKIKGTIDFHTEYGQGSSVKLNLPLTLAVFEALMVGLGNETYAIPIDSVNETIKVPHDEIVTLRGRESVNLRGNILGVVRLGDMFNFSTLNGAHEVPIVVIQAIGKTIGIAVDTLFKQEDILIKPLDKLLSGISGISGSTIMGDGKVILVLDPTEIVGLMEGIRS